MVSDPPAREPRPSAEVLATQRSEKREQERILREEAGTTPSPSESLHNTCSTFKTLEEEQLAREQAVTGQIEILRRELLIRN